MIDSEIIVPWKEDAEVQGQDAKLTAELKAFMDPEFLDGKTDTEVKQMKDKLADHSKLPAYIAYVENDVECEWSWDDPQGRVTKDHITTHLALAH